MLSASHATLLYMSKDLLRSFVIRTAVLLIIFGLAYLLLSYLPGKRAKELDARIAEKEALVVDLENLQLQLDELKLYTPSNPSIYSELTAYSQELQEKIVKLEEKRAFVQNTYPQELESFDATVRNYQIVWLEFSAFYDYVAVLFAYNPTEDLPTTNNTLSNEEFSRRLSATKEAINSYMSRDKTYQANNQFQRADGTTVTLDSVTSFTLSDNSLASLREALRCFDQITHDSKNRCRSEMSTVKQHFLTELNNILQSENRKRINATVPSLLENIK